MIEAICKDKDIQYAKQNATSPHQPNPLPMNTKKFVLGTVAGGVVYFLLGFVVYAILLESFFASHAGSATGVTKADMQFWPLILGNLAQAALLSYIFLQWANIKTFGAGLTAGATIGFLMTLGFDMIMYDTSNVMDLTGSIVDTLVYTIITALVGGVVGVVLGLGKS